MLSTVSSIEHIVNKRDSDDLRISSESLFARRRLNRKLSNGWLTLLLRDVVDAMVWR